MLASRHVIVLLVLFFDVSVLVIAILLVIFTIFIFFLVFDRIKLVHVHIFDTLLFVLLLRAFLLLFLDELGTVQWHFIRILLFFVHV